MPERGKGKDSWAADLKNIQPWLEQEPEDSRRTSPEKKNPKRKANASDHVESCMGKFNKGYIKKVNTNYTHIHTNQKKLEQERKYYHKTLLAFKVNNVS